MRKWYFQGYLPPRLHPGELFGIPVRNGRWILSPAPRRLSFQQRLLPGSGKFIVAHGAKLERQALAVVNLTAEPRAATEGLGKSVFQDQE